MLRRALFLLPALALPAQAASLLPMPRPLVLAEDAMLRLGDIFENAGGLANQAVGAAPAPGRRMVLDSADLSAIARRHGLAWRALSGDERSIVERPGRPVDRPEVEALLARDLARHGLAEDAEFDLPGFSPPMIPAAALPEIELEALHYDARTRRFGATLVVAAEGMATQRQRLAGRAMPTTTVVVAARRLAVGEVIAARDIDERRIRAERVRPGTAQRAADVVGRQLRRPIGSDLPFMLSDLVAPVVVAKNQPVLMVLDAPGLALTARGRALEDAGMGDTVRVMNLLSRSVVEAEAIGPGRVRVTQGAVPVLLAGRN